ncbi:ribokinase [Pseudoduganella lurida]|uniref:Ribokinase n=1 Tax=Pseudoduganella lurida TaxID=1036180 RepID=A0A562RN42_9BURK|nr:ribokinase [Pseudoduganella lurida]TWI69846.1 ribokinase [Pseudoduganella lurida]
MINVFGSINVDIAVGTARLPLPGETVLGGQAHVCAGGKGANQAHAARCFGVPVRLFGATGDDAFAATALGCVVAAGVDTAGVVPIAGAATGIAVILVDGGGENSIVVAAGANLAATAQQLTDADLAGGRCLLLQLETDLFETMALARRARAMGRTVILNASPLQPDRLPDLDALDILIVNARELAALDGASDPREAALALARRHAIEVLVTLGGEGALLAAGDGKVLTVPAYRVPVCDTTGAGDTFAGVFAAATAEGMDRHRAMDHASAAAALACTKAGAQPAQPHREDIERLMAEHRPAPV